MAVCGVTGPRYQTAPPPAVMEDGLTFHRSPAARGGGIWRDWREVRSLEQTICAVAARWRPDVLHAHSPALTGWAARRAARALGLPLVYEIRAFWEDAAVGSGTGREGSVKYRLTRALENHVVAGADAIVTICQGLKGDLVARGVAPQRITIVPNGVDLALFGAPGPPDPALAEALDLGAEGARGPVIGFIGSFYAYEGLDDLIAAMPALVARHPAARLLLVGGGPCEAALRNQAAASPAARAIRFVGRVPHHEVERYYALADIMAYPRKAGRLTELVTPLKPLEAMAQGKLVAASAVGGHRELIADGRTGTLFAADDPAACAMALGALLDDRAAWPERRAAARRHIEQHHDWQANATRYHDLYQTLLARGGC